MLTVLGTCDAVTTCECCGRSDLKSTVVLSAGDGEASHYFGSECAAKAMKTSKAAVGKAVRSAAKEAAERVERERSRRAYEERAAYDAWKVATFGDAGDSLDRHRRYRREVA